MIDIGKCKSFGEIAIMLFGKNNYTNREKAKKYLDDNGIDHTVWREEQKLKQKNKQEAYCLNCGSKIEGDYRKKFCSHSCSATYNNKRRCKNEKIINSVTIDKYDEYIKKWKSNKVDGRRGNYGVSVCIRKYLYSKYNCSCQNCGWNKVNPYTGKIPLEIHHIDGDCTNNKEENLQLLCKNCHSLTENYGSRNKNCTRIDKRKR